MSYDDAKRIAASLGIAGLFGWLGKWLGARENRLATEAKAQAEVERTEVREDHVMGRHMLVELEKERQRTFVSQLGQAECMSRVTDLQARVDMLERERAEDKARIAKLEDLVEALVSRLTRYESTPPAPAE